MGDLTQSQPEQRSLALRLLGRVRAELEFASAVELLDGSLEDTLVLIENQIQDVASAVAAECFLYRVELDLHSVHLVPGARGQVVVQEELA